MTNPQSPNPTTYDEELVEILKLAKGIKLEDGLGYVEYLTDMRQDIAAIKAATLRRLPELWYIRTAFFHQGGETIMGGFETQELALEVRTMLEAKTGRTYFVDSKRQVLKVGQAIQDIKDNLGETR